ncbi:MAG: flagellar biosynthesis protein FlgJ [Desulfobacteraceae bacterium]|nr:MAG: flagellar biosynthesis protein FlgJ [Desulfobacteraceae bacterium]
MIVKDAVPLPVSVNNMKNASQEKLKKACADFESIFLSYMLKTMRAGVSGIDPVGKSHESKILYAMLDEKLSDEIAESGGIGLANVFLDKLEERKQGGI